MIVRCTPNRSTYAASRATSPSSTSARTRSVGDHGIGARAESGTRPLSGSHTWSGAGHETASCATDVSSVDVLTTPRPAPRSSTACSSVARSSPARPASAAASAAAAASSASRSRARTASSAPSPSVTA
ncbi:Uncharacterised protein [Mycobacteroides abscessus]|nr:Uncharacterised protein [Mycobacteroides abscessus]